LEKTVKVHEDTHRALKRLKVEGRKKSLDEVIREMVKKSTGVSVEKVPEKGRTASLTSYSPN
jgi:predicted CopG family antitoxin